MDESFGNVWDPRRMTRAYRLLEMAIRTQIMGWMVIGARVITGAPPRLTVFVINTITGTCLGVFCIKWYYDELDT